MSPEFAGQAWLPEAGLAYYKARMYSPTLGRFMQTDPIGYGDGLNWYNYVGSDPVNKVDPSGMMYSIPRLSCTQPVWGLVGEVSVVQDPVCTWNYEFVRNDLPGDRASRAGEGGGGGGSKAQKGLRIPTLCDHRAWHELKVAEKVDALRAAGFLVATNVSISLIGPNGEGYNGPGRATADYIAFRMVENLRTYYIGEVKTGDASLTLRQMQHYGNGFAQI